MSIHIKVSRLYPANTLLWEQYGQPVLFIVLLLTAASHSWPFLHLHITFLWEPIETSIDFILFFFDHCFTNSGSNVAKSLIPAITLAPEHIGHFSPLERALTLACHSWPQAPLHHQQNPWQPTVFFCNSSSVVGMEVLLDIILSHSFATYYLGLNLTTIFSLRYKIHNCNNLLLI